MILLSIFLAVSVDKLSEVKEVKKDMSMRTEQQQERRKERREQLDALKNVEDFSNISSTLHRLVKFYSVLNGQHHRQRQWQQQLKKQKQQKKRVYSLQLNAAPQVSVEEKRRNLRKSVSDPVHDTMGLDLDDEDLGLRDTYSEVTSTTVPSSDQHPGVIKTGLKNPLARFQQSFAEAEERHITVKRNLSIKSEHHSLSTPGSSVTTSRSTDGNISTVPSSSSLGSSVFGLKPEDLSLQALADFNTDGQELSANVQRHYSIRSEPPLSLQCASSPKKEPLDHFRCQSLPLSDDSSVTGPLDDHDHITFDTKVEFTTGDMEDENEEKPDGEQSHKKSITSPGLTLVGTPHDSRSSARLERLSSLEFIQPVSLVVYQGQHRKEKKSSRVSGGLILIALSWTFKIWYR